MRRVIALLALAAALGAGAIAEAGPQRQEVRITVRGWPCEEDEVLAGRGDFDGRRWDRYVCWNPGW